MTAELAQPGSGAALAARTDRRLFWYGLSANGVGAVVVVLFLFYLGPKPPIGTPNSTTSSMRSILGFIVYMAFALPFGRYWAARFPFKPIGEWLRAERPATVEERLAVLRYPLVWARRSAIIWAVGAVLFAALNSSLGLVNTIGIAAITAVGGVASCSLQYLVVERIMRPITARALGGGAPPENPAPGVAARLTMAWTLATGVFLLGIGGLATAYLIDDSFDDTRIIVAIVFLAANGLFGGLMAMLIAARARGRSTRRGQRSARAGGAGRSRDPRAGRRRQRGGPRPGGLQPDGRGARGTGEAEGGVRHVRRLRCRRAHPQRGTALEGEEVEVTAMFVDIRDFTGFAERESAPVVVSTLNALFEELVPVVHGHGGHIDKFVGDGFLAVFGAPRRMDDHADQGFAAAIEIAKRVDQRLGERLSIGIGLNSGKVVAGNVGGDGRYDFSVIGDVINVASRVEAATRDTGDAILVSEHTMRALTSAGEQLEERPG